MRKEVTYMIKKKEKKKYASKYNSLKGTFRFRTMTSLLSRKSGTKCHVK